jgi:hypothetical protein
MPEKMLVLRTRLHYTREFESVICFSSSVSSRNQELNQQTLICILKLLFQLPALLPQLQLTTIKCISPTRGFVAFYRCEFVHDGNILAYYKVEG